MTADDHVFGEAALGIDRRVRLRDRVAGLLHRREIDDLVGDAAVLHLAIRRFDEAVFVHARVGRERVDQTDIRTFRRLDRADTAVMGRMHVAHFEAGALRGSDRLGPSAERRRLCVISDSGLVWSMNCESCDEPKNSRTAAAAGFALIRSCGMTVSISTDDMRSLIARSMRRRPMRYWFSINSPTERTRRLPRLSMSSISPLPSRRSTSVFDHGEDVVLAQHAHRIRRIEVEAHVHLHATDGRKVVAVGIEEQRLEHRRRGIDRGRLARTHHAIDVEQRVFTRHVLVDRERVADIGADIDVIDVEDRQFLVAELVDRLEAASR